MLRIRLQRIGRKNQSRYRIVVAEHARAVKRKSIEVLGHYDSSVRPHVFSMNKTKYDAWIKKGAQPSPRMVRLVEQAKKAAAETRK